MRTVNLFVVGVSIMAVLGCKTPPADPATADVAPADKHQVLVLDSSLKSDLFVSGVDARRMPDDRLEVLVNIQNNSGSPMDIQVKTTFKDDRGFSTGDETPFSRVKLSRGQIYTYNTKSMNTKAKDFAVEIRKAQ